MTILLDNWDLLDPARFQRDVEEQHGGAIFNRWSVLDPALERAQLDSALGLELSNATLLDRWRLIQEVEAGGGGGGSVVSGSVAESATAISAQSNVATLVRAVAEPATGADSESGVVSFSLPLPANLVTRFSADSIVGLSDGASLTGASWVDSQNAIAADTVNGTAPTFRTNVVGTKPSVRFAGSGNLGISSPGALKTAIDSQVYTVLIAAKSIGGTGSFDCIFGATAGSNSFLFYADGTKVGRYAGSSQGFEPTFAAQTSFFSFGNVSGGAAAIGINLEQSMLNGTSYSTTTSLAPGTGGNDLTIGAINAANVFSYHGDVFEILVWNVALTPAQYMQAEMWLRDKYALAYPWAAVSKMPIFLGDSLGAGVGASHLINTNHWIAAQTNLGLTYGQYQVLAIGGQTMDNMTSMASSYVTPIAAQIGKELGVICWEWANQRDSTTTKGALMLAALKAVPNIQTVFGTSTSASAYDNSADRASFDAAWDAVWAGPKTNIDSYMSIHTDAHIGVDGSYATFSSAGDSVHLPDATQPFLAAIYSSGFNALP